MARHKVFISYHHANDKSYKRELVRLRDAQASFIDRSVGMGDIPDYLDDQAIRRRVRDEHLRDSTVTIVLIGTATKGRKHVDWEIYSSMYNGPVNKRSGILVISLPTVGSQGDVTAPHGDGEKDLYSGLSWETVSSTAAYGSRYPYMPGRLIDNLVKPEAKISVTPWSRIENNGPMLHTLIDLAFRDRRGCEYDIRRPMRRANS